MDALNPKDAIASAKPDLSLVTAAMMEGIAAALANGAVKYGRGNWRQTPVRALVYTAAAARHIKAWEDGQDAAPDSGVHHLDHAIASLCIMRDAARAGTLVDDRVVLPGPAKPAPEAPPAKRYGLFWEDSGKRSAFLPLDYVSIDEAKAAAVEGTGVSFAVSGYLVKEVTP